jgi:hypothetical protein
VKAWMKGLAILIILLTPILPGESLLTAQDKKHITAPLACQAPPRDATTGKLIDAGNPIFRDTFSPREEVWVALNVNILKNQEEGARLYVIHHKNGNLSNEDKLEDVTCAYEEISQINLPLGSEGFIYIPVWDHPRFYQYGYDVVVDFKPFGKYNVGQDIVDGLHPEGYLDVKGFHVPEYWVCLESISFNHTPKCGYYDAIDIRQNCQKGARVLEWEKGKKSCPAAYIKNRSITIKAVFSASKNLDMAYIGARRCSGGLGDIIQKEIYFDKSCIFKNYKSGAEQFQVHLPTPDEITSFYQEWEWYFQHNNDHKVYYAGKSRNKIFIILTQPQSPWNRSEKSKPWTEVLDLACTWAHGETTPEGAASKITHYLYHHVGSKYDEADDNQFIKSPGAGGFRLGKFLSLIPDVCNVNCAVMGKALVTFSNVLGCGTNYRLLELEKDDKNYELNCIIPVGVDWGCTYDNLRFHAFGSIGDKIFDPTFYYACDSDCPVQSPQPVYIMANIPWEEYKIRLIKEPISDYPRTFRFNIISEKMPEK